MHIDAKQPSPPTVSLTQRGAATTKFNPPALAGIVRSTGESYDKRR